MAKHPFHYYLRRFLMEFIESNSKKIEALSTYLENIHLDEELDTISKYPTTRSLNEDSPIKNIDKLYKLKVKRPYAKTRSKTNIDSRKIKYASNDGSFYKSQKKVIDIKRKRTGRKGHSYTFSSENTHKLQAQILYTRYGVIQNEPSLKIKTIIDICENNLSEYIKSNYLEKTEKRFAYQNYCLGFINLMNPINCIDFINHIFSQDEIKQDSKNILYRFCIRLLKTNLVYQGLRYSHWLDHLGKIEHRPFQAAYKKYLISEHHNSNIHIIDEEHLLNFNPEQMECSGDSSLITSPSDKKLVIRFSILLSDTTDYYLSYISDLDFLNYKTLGKDKILNFSDFHSNYLFYRLRSLLNLPVKPGENTNHTKRTKKRILKYIHFLYKCLKYSTENHMQHSAHMIYAFLNTYTISKHIQRSSTLSQQINLCTENFKNYYEVLYSPDLYSNPSARWPLPFLLQKLILLEEKQPIETDFKSFDANSIVKLTNKSVIHARGTLIHSFHKQARKVHENPSNTTYTLDYISTDDFISYLESI